jgi:hypothetical protein
MLWYLILYIYYRWQRASISCTRWTRARTHTHTHIIYIYIYIYIYILGGSVFQSAVQDGQRYGGGMDGGADAGSWRTSVAPRLRASCAHTPPLARRSFRSACRQTPPHTAAAKAGAPLLLSSSPPVQVSRQRKALALLLALLLVPHVLLDTLQPLFTLLYSGSIKPL